jgi:hypothetical protein
MKRLSPYQKIIGGFQNIDNRYWQSVQTEISEKIIGLLFFWAMSHSLNTPTQSRVARSLSSILTTTGTTHFPYFVV